MLLSDSSIKAIQKSEIYDSIDSHRPLTMYKCCNASWAKNTQKKVKTNAKTITWEKIQISLTSLFTLDLKLCCVNPLRHIGLVPIVFVHSHSFLCGFGTIWKYTQSDIMDQIYYMVLCRLSDMSPFLTKLSQIVFATLERGGRWEGKEGVCIVRAQCVSLFGGI